MAPDILKGIRHGHILFQIDELRRHDASGAVLRILQELVQKLSLFRVGVLQDSLYDIGRQLFQHINRIIDVQIVDDGAQLVVRDACHDLLLLFRLQLGEHVRRQLLRQHAEYDHCLFRVQFFHE